MIAAALPSATPAQSNTDSEPATAGIEQSCSTDISLRNWARELRAPLEWFFEAMRARTVRISSSVTPYFLAYAGAIIEYIAAAVSVRAVPSFGGSQAVRPW